MCQKTIYDLCFYCSEPKPSLETPHKMKQHISVLNCRPLKSGVELFIMSETKPTFASPPLAVVLRPRSPLSFLPLFVPGVDPLPT